MGFFNKVKNLFSRKKESTEAVIDDDALEDLQSLGRLVRQDSITEVTEDLQFRVEEQLKCQVMDVMGFGYKDMPTPQPKAPTIDDLINSIPEELRTWKRSDHKLYQPKPKPFVLKSEDVQLVHRHMPLRFLVKAEGKGVCASRGDI